MPYPQYNVPYHHPFPPHCSRCRAFDGEPEQGKKLLSLAKQFLLHSKPNETIVWNISRHLSDVYGINF